MVLPHLDSTGHGWKARNHRHRRVDESATEAPDCRYPLSPLLMKLYTKSQTCVMVYWAADYYDNIP